MPRKCCSLGAPAQAGARASRASGQNDPYAQGAGRGAEREGGRKREGQAGARERKKGREGGREKGNVNRGAARGRLVQPTLVCTRATSRHGTAHTFWN